MPAETGLIALSLVMASTANTQPSGAPTHIAMGDGQVAGEKISPYTLEWRQCALQEGVWVDMGPLLESAVLIGDAALRVRQESRQPNGVKITGTTYLDRKSLAPLRMEQDVKSAEGAQLVLSEHQIGPDGYQARITRNGEAQVKSGAINRKMYHGGALGLPLATLNYDNAPFVFAASMMGFDATYSITASLAGKETWRHESRDVEVLLVDVEWAHNELGDIYPPGPDASGGRYWIAQNPPEGFPYVPRYKTDTYAVEFVSGACDF